MLLIQYGWYSYEKEKFEHRDRRSNRRKLSKDWSHAAARRELSEARRGLEQILPWSFQRPGMAPVNTLVSACCLQVCKTIHFCCLSHLVCDTCYGSHRKLTQSIFELPILLSEKGKMIHWEVGSALHQLSNQEVSMLLYPLRTAGRQGWDKNLKLLI